MAEKQAASRLYARVAQDLASKIAQAVYPVGKRLSSERDLAQTYSVSRPTVREAIIALELDGLVEVRQGSGVYVIAQRPRGGKANEADIGQLELLEARKAIENEACALAAVRITDEELARLRLIVAKMQDENAHDVTLSEDADRRFHMLVATSTKNSAMAAAVQMLWEARARSPRHPLLSAKPLVPGMTPRIDEHSEIVAALQARKPDAARQAMRRHLTRALDSLLAATEVEEIDRARAKMAAEPERYANWR